MNENKLYKESMSASVEFWEGWFGHSGWPPYHGAHVSIIVHAYMSEVTQWPSEGSLKLRRGEVVEPPKKC